MIEKQPKKNTV
uniref:Uncharacterized protein n=1 Tax=Rhizophora mucronata TaxID=61149 RepID=A0A2P2R4F6_RHIMU